MRRFGNSEVSDRKYTAWTVASETGYRITTVPLKAPIQRQSGHLERRRSEDKNARNVQSAIPQGQLFWRARHQLARPHQLYRRPPSLLKNSARGVTVSAD